MPGKATECALQALSLSDNVFHKPKDYYKVCIMGTARVGKTAIINQFLYDTFVADYKPTIEEMHRGEYEVASIPLTLDILDTSGAYPFPAMRALNISNSDAFILVYSVDNQNSFEEVRQLRDQILQAKNQQKVPIVIVANKCDLPPHQHKVSKPAAETIALLDWENGFVESSAKNNINIIGIFKELLLQANVKYALSPAVKKRRMSFPSYNAHRNSNAKQPQGKILKRHSCTVS